MTLSIEQLQAELNKCLPTERLSFLKGYLASIDDPVQKARETALIGFGFSSLPKQLHVILMIHGIRTNSEWQEALRDMLHESPDVKAYPIGYDYFDALRFWFPFTRNGPMKHVLEIMRAAMGKHNGAKFSLVAHSFGTHIVSKILQGESGIHLENILLCGSIIPTRFKWHAVANMPPQEKFLNEVGWTDIWPILARATTVGYGVSGSYGFKSPSVYDRFHNFGHSDFFKGDHMRKFWLPFLLESKIVGSPDNKRNSRGYLVGALAWFPLKSLLMLAISIFVYQRYWNWEWLRAHLLAALSN